MPIEVIKGGKTSAEVRFWTSWLLAADHIRNHLHADGDGFDPIRYNETATVGFLVAAAGRAGYVALPEFTEDNRKLPIGRVRAGRCDLWIANEDWTINWLIEFKLCWFGPRSKRGLLTKINDAIRDAFERDRQEASERWGCAIFCPADRWFDLTVEERSAWSTPKLIRCLAEHVDLAFCIDGLAGPAYILVRRVSPRARNLNKYLINTNVLDFN